MGLPQGGLNFHYQQFTLPLQLRHVRSGSSHSFACCLKH